MSTFQGSASSGLRKFAIPLAFGLLLAGLAACGDDNGDMGADPMMDQTPGAADPAAPPVDTAPN